MANNVVFTADDYISVFVGEGKKSGDLFVVGDLVGVLTTGSGTPDGQPFEEGQRLGVGNKQGWSSVALYGGVRVNVPAGATYAVGDRVYATSAGVVTKTASGNKNLGVVTHEPKTSATGAGQVVVKLGY
jgi:predicted RecA/RadA family phage recombinase